MDELIKGLEASRRARTEKRRSLTKNLVAQTNDELSSGMPYVVDVAKLISDYNGVELFLDGLANSLQSDAQAYGESIAVKRALSSVMKQIKHMEPGDKSDYVTPAELHEIGKYLVDMIDTVKLRDSES
jgi:hypothetical protein